MKVASAVPGEREIFEASLELPTRHRRAFIEAVSREDKELEERVLRLLAAHTRGRDAGSHIVRPRFHENDSCGPYRPIEKLGEGGAGVVYLAEQTFPVRRLVALKIIKHGLDAEEVITRFESERQSLALMDHRHIARILDAGASEKGRSYFAMEYVPGEPVVSYCERRELSLSERLHLFADICFAVQHAHQKGIIHRDLKPSNVLIMEEDGVPLPKIIDFGIAKAVSRRSTDHAFRAEPGAVIGTPEYTSPEQADPSTLDVDTRSDIYSLGAILYELVTGSLPLDLRGARDVRELQRILREEQIPLPSRRTSGPWPMKLKGELDWILMTALATAPAERYPTAQAFGEDVRRHLNHEPIRAGEPGTAIRARKFVLRHRAILGVSAVVFSVLVIGLAVAFTGMLEAQRERDAARVARDESEAVTGFLAHMLSSPAMRGKDITVRAVLDEASKTVADEFAERPLLEARLRATIGSTYGVLGVYDEAERNLNGSIQILEEQYARDHPRRLEVEGELLRVYRDQGLLEEAERLAVSLLERRRVVDGPEHPATVEAITELSAVYTAQGRDAEAMELLELEVSSSRRVHGDGDLRTFTAMHNLAQQYANHGRYDEAESLRQQLLESARRELGDRHPLTLSAQRGLATLYAHQGRLDEAKESYDEALRLSRRALGPEHPYTLRTATRFAELLELQGKLFEAETQLRQTVGACERAIGREHFETIRATNDLGRVLFAQAKLDAAGIFLSRAVSLGIEVLDPESAALARYRIDLARYHLHRGRAYAAETLLLDAHRVLSAKESIDRPSLEALRDARKMLAGIDS